MYYYTWCNGVCILFYVLHNFSTHLCFTVGDEDDGEDKDVTKVLKHSCPGNLTVCLLSDKLIKTFLL